MFRPAAVVMVLRDLSTRRRRAYMFVAVQKLIRLRSSVEKRLTTVIHVRYVDVYTHFFFTFNALCFPDDFTWIGDFANFRMS